MMFLDVHIHVISHENLLSRKDMFDVQTSHENDSSWTKGHEYAHQETS